MAEGHTESLLTPTEVDAFRRLGTERRFDEGQRLIVLGAGSTEVFYLLEGVVKIVVTSTSGAESIFGRRHAGDFVGEMSALNGEPRSADVIAVAQTRAIIIPAARFGIFLERHPSVAIAMLRMQSRRLDEMTSRVMLGDRSVRARIATRLVELTEAGTSAAVELTQSDLARYVDASREWTSKALGSLRADGTLRTERGRVVILDRQALLDASRER